MTKNHCGAVHPDDTLSMRIVSKQWHLAHGRALELGPTARIMGVLNVTPDSFSDGGRFDRLDDAVAQAERMIEEGADIVDIGGETTKPGAVSVSASEEQARVLPVIETLAARRVTCATSSAGAAGSSVVRDASSTSNASARLAGSNRALNTCGVVVRYWRCYSAEQK